MASESERAGQELIKRELRETLYGPSNPPPSVEEAQKRITNLFVTQGKIEAQIKYTEADDFPDGESYKIWKKRALGALGHYRGESKFLERWVWQQKDPQAEKARKKKYSDLKSLRQKVLAQMDVLVTHIRSEYQPRYSTQQQPKTLAEAQTRLSELSALKARLCNHFSQIKNESLANKWSQSLFVAARAPLQTILMDVEGEIAVVRKCVRERTSEEGRIDWRDFLINLVERAIAKGFKLTKKERQVFDYIAAFHRLSATKESASTPEKK